MCDLRLDRIAEEFDGLVIGAGPSLSPLEQTTVDQQAVLGVHLQLMAEASRAIGCAVVEKGEVIHAAYPFQSINDERRVRKAALINPWLRSSRQPWNLPFPHKERMPVVFCASPRRLRTPIRCATMERRERPVKMASSTDWAEAR